MAVRVTLCEEADDNVFVVFLPRHYADTFTDEDMAAIKSYSSVLPYIQREERDHRPPSVTDGCIIRGAGIVPSAMLTITITLLIFIAFLLRNLTQVSGHDGHVNHCCYYYFF